MNANAIRKLAKQHGEASRGDGHTYEGDELSALVSEWFREKLRHVPEDQRDDAIAEGVKGFLEGWRS